MLCPDPDACKPCSAYAGGLFTDAEVIRLFGDYMEIHDGDLILPNVHPNCLCLLVAKLVSESASESKVMMHDDFVEIRAAFMKVYGKQQGGKEFKLWLQQNGLHPTHSYGRRWKS